MARIHLITGGSRSGKSSYAQNLAESLPGRRVYIATCPVVDDEMRRRIDAHRQARAGRGWDTFEEAIDLRRALAEAAAWDVVLVDCLTLWVSNLMYQANDLDESAIAVQCDRMLESARRHPGTILFVTNEVGMGIVPENALARRFRDLAGRCNQIVAASADAVTLVCCGLPLHLKGTGQ